MKSFQAKLALIVVCVVCSASLVFGAAKYDYKVTQHGEYDFYSVLDTLLERFAHDLNGIDSNIHKISNYKVSAIGVPKSFKETLRNKVQEAITNQSRLKMVKCVACFKTLVTTEDKNLVIRKGVLKSEELEKIARDLGVRIFMDTSFSFTAREMVFSASLYDVYRKEVIWSQSYSSKNHTKPKKKPDTNLLQAKSKASSYRLSVSPGIFYLPGSNGLIAYPGVSASMLEILGGFWNHFGLTFSGMTPPLITNAKAEGEVLLDGGGILELRLYANLGGKKFRTIGFLGAGPMFTANFQSFIANAGATVDIGKKYGVTGSLFYIAPSLALQNEDFVDYSGGTINFDSETNGVKVSGLGMNIGFNMHW